MNENEFFLNKKERLTEAPLLLLKKPFSVIRLKCKAGIASKETIVENTFFEVLDRF